MMKRGVFLSKKAQDMETMVYHVLIQIAILVMVFLEMLAYLKSVRENTLFEKMYLSRDVALLMNTIYAAPENIGYVYAAGKTNLSKYIFNTQENYVIVNEKTAVPSQEKFFHYGSDRFFNEDFPLIQDAQLLTFMKNDKYVKVGKSGTGNLNALICPEIDTSSKNWKNKVIIDPGHGAREKADEPKDYGYSTDKLKESQYTTDIATPLKALGFKATRDFNLYTPFEERLLKVAGSDIIISLHVGNYSPDKNNVNAFISAEGLKKAESRKLACLILNNLLNRLNIDNVAIIPVFPSQLKKDDPQQILLQDKIAVLLELGNVNNKASVQALKPFDIANAINDGLRGFYETH